MAENILPITDAEFRARNADIDNAGKGLLWGLLLFVPPAFFYYLARRIFPSLNPIGAAIGGTILVAIPFANALLGIALFIYASKRIGRNFIKGHIALFVILVVAAVSLVVGLGVIRS